MNRRQFLGKVGRTALAAGAMPGVKAQEQTAAGRPSIVVILADDMGYSDIGCYGGEIETPNLDRLAANGLRFTQFYNAARCCPTRAALLTGLYPHQAGVGRMVTRDGKFVPGPYQGFLNDQCATIAEVLRPSGYRTYMSGKWHVGEDPAHWPCHRGFDRYFGLISGASSYYEIVNSDRRMAKDCEPFTPPEEGFYMTDAFSDFAVECINDHEDPGTPFFLYTAYTAPHWPLHAPKDVIDKYRGVYDVGWDELRKTRHARMKDLGIVDSAWPLSPRDGEVPPWAERDTAIDWPLRMAVYAAMVDRMDQGIGRIVAALEAKGQLDNTLILFLSDNGGCHEDVEGRNLNTPGSLPGERGSYVAYRRPWANASNTPFRLFKHWVHEGGCSTPLIAHWPKGMAARGALTSQVSHIIDIMPTCVELARTSYPESLNGTSILPNEGKSMMSYLQEAPSEPRTLFWEHMGNTAIRDGDWKLVSRKEEQPWELYNLVDDRTELDNRIDAEPELAKSIKNKWDAWAGRVGVHAPR